jgi:hypothetical protein
VHLQRGIHESHEWRSVVDLKALVNNEYGKDARPLIMRAGRLAK